MYSNVKDQLIKVTTGAVTTTGVVANSTVDVSKENRLMDEFTVVAKGTVAAPTTLTAALEGSLDGVNWSSIQAITQANDGAPLYVAQKLVQFLRINVTALTLGSATNVIFTYVAS
jgi:hypothetical protein